MSFLKRSFLVVGFVVFSFSQLAQASFLIEPHFGYNLSGSGTTGSGTTASEFKYTGVQYGLRAGYQYLGFMGGLAYNRSNYVWKLSTSQLTPTINTNYEDSFTRNEVGLFLGYQFPIFFRLWGAYYFTNTAEDVDTTHSTISIAGAMPDLYPTGYQFKGNTKELGIGYTGLPFVSINLSFRNVVHDNTTTGAVGISNNEFVLGISAPFSVL